MRLRVRPSPYLVAGLLMSLLLLAGGALVPPVFAGQAPAATPAATPLATPDATGDPSRHGRLPGPGPEGEIGVQWTARSEGEVGIPIAADELVLVRNGATLTAYTLADGDVAWTVERGQAISDAFFANGVAYVSDGTALVALDAATGDVLWESNLAFGSVTVPATEVQAVPLQPAVADGVAYVLTGTLAYAIDASNGDYVWRYDAESLTAVTPPTVTATTVIAAATDADGSGVTLSLDRESGQPLAAFAQSDIYVGFAADEDLVVAWNRAALVTFYDYSGVPTLSLTCPISGVPVIVDGTVYAACGSDLVGIDPATGQILPLLAAVGWSLSGATDDQLLVTVNFETERQLIALDLDTLSIAWQLTLPPTVEGTLQPSGTLANGMVVVTTRLRSEIEGGPPTATLAGISGTDGAFGQPLPLAANPPAPGSFLRIASDTDLLAAPSVEGAPIAALAANDQVLITGQIEEADGTIWWQIDDPRSGRTGWVTPDVFEAGGE